MRELPISDLGGQSGGITRTLHFWESRTSQPLNAEDARQMVEAITGFFSQLGAWDSDGLSADNQAAANTQGD